MLTGRENTIYSHFLRFTGRGINEDKVVIRDESPQSGLHREVGQGHGDTLVELSVSDYPDLSLPRHFVHKLLQPGPRRSDREAIARAHDEGPFADILRRGNGRGGLRRSHLELNDQLGEEQGVRSEHRPPGRSLAHHMLPSTTNEQCVGQPQPPGSTSNVAR
jgi:hypothetical protein